MLISTSLSSVPMDTGVDAKAASLPATVCCMVDLGADFDGGVDLLIVGHRIGVEAPSVDKGNNGVSSLMMMAAKTTGAVC